MTDGLGAILLTLTEFPERINAAVDAVDIGDAGILFQEITVKRPKLIGANNGGELAFFQTISWLYVLYKEAGRDRLTFVLNKASLYGVNSDRLCEKHIRLVDRMRTYFQHNLNLQRKADRDTAADVERWLAEQCEGILPEKDEGWFKCAKRIVQDAHECLQVVEGILKAINADEFREVIIEEWKEKSRILQGHEFDPLIQEMAAEIGREDLMELDVAIALRKRHERDWIQSLKLVMNNRDQREEAQKLIFATIVSLARRHPLLPADIATRFDIPAGDMRLDRLGRIALDVWMSEPCNPAELLEKLSPYVERWL